ncbi:hypothetical protein GL2_23320 [Microbulbifer sp. GL-2]|nr:hypothetical protein GL2_23320 [Microbulbifer sp. GL-2]
MDTIYAPTPKAQIEPQSHYPAIPAPLPAAGILLTGASAKGNLRRAARHNAEPDRG